MKFQRVYIEITNVCNLQCAFCPKNHRKKEVMAVDFFENIAKQVKKVCDHIYLHVMGEPLLHPHLDQILAVCEKIHLQVNLTTNGTKLSNTIDILSKTNALRKITISVQSLEENGETNWKTYLENIVTAVHRLPSSIIVEYRFWNWDHSMLAKEQVQFLLQQYGKEAIYPTIIKDNKYQNSIKLDHNAYIMFGTTFVWPIQSQVSHIQGYCPALSKQIAVLVDGSVVPCCLDSEGKMVLGNLKQDSLENILESDTAQIYKQSFWQGKRIHDLCQHCLFYKVKSDKTK